jgi:hypothetical protein
MTARTLSLCIMARKPAPRVRAILEQFRPLVDEIVLAADRSGDPAILDQCADLADKRFALDPAPLNQRLGWLHAQCDGDWIFRFDDDEAPSRKLLETLPELIARRRPMQYGMPRRWLYGSTASWISQWPWTPDYQFRLVRNAPGVWRFPALMHAPLEVLGELSLVDVPLYHSELLISELDERRAKRALYDARRPDVNNGHFPVNGYYTPEDFDSPATAQTPADDLELIDAVHTGSPGLDDAVPLAPVRAVEAAEAERFNASREVSPTAYCARVEVVRPLNGTRPGSTTELEVDVTNLGDEPWTWGEYPPFFRLGYTWRTGGDEEVAHGRAFFTETVHPGTTTRVVARLQAPAEPGSYRLRLDVVHEHVRWFDQPTELEIEVR